MERYLTRWINENIHPMLQSAMWNALDRVDKELDYLQIFNFKSCGDLTIIEHHQEQPRFSQTIYVPNFIVSNEMKVYIYIDHTGIMTMMLSEEY